MSAKEDLTELLRAAGDGDSSSLDRLYGIVYDELRNLARKVRSGESRDTINTTALVHESYIKLLKSVERVSWNDRVHFFRVAARAMRQVLIRSARDRKAQKRGGGAPHITLSESIRPELVDNDALLVLDEVLTLLEKKNKRQSDIVECRFFAGLTIEETAAALGVSPMTVKRDWRFARAWLVKEINEAA